MTDNPFADLDNEFGGADDSTDDTEASGRDADPVESPPEDDADATDASTLSTDGDDHAEPESTTESPRSETAGSRRTVDPTTTEAFDYSPEMQQAVYPRPETWEAFEDAMELDMERVFRAHDVRNMSKREIHDALFSFVVENADEIARRALSARGIDADDSGGQD